MPTYIISYTQGNSPGPFDVYLSGSSGLNLYASSVTLNQLLNGFIVTFADGIPSSSVELFDVSYGCFTNENVPFPTPSPTVTPTISITPSITPTISFTPTRTPSISRTPSVTPSFTPPPSVTPTISVTPSITQSPGPPSPTRTPTVTRTPSISAIPTYSIYGIMGIGYPNGYQACVYYNQNQGIFNGGSVYFATPPDIIIGAIAYKIDPISGYIPFNGGNLWWAVGIWSLGISRAIQISNSGVVLDMGQICILIGI